MVAKINSRVCFTLQLISPSSKEIRAETQHRSLKAGTDMEALEECCFLA